jgi:phage gpG-like protein
MPIKSTGKPIKSIIRDLRAMESTLATKVGTVAENFFLDNFKLQGFQGDNGLEKWAPRKDKSKKGRGRGLLVQTGALRRSIRKDVSRLMVAVRAGSPAEKYADAHNFGSKETVSIGAHSRRKISTAKVRYSNRSSRSTRTKQVRFESGTMEVSAHQRKMNLPQRKFIGVSKQLDRRIKVLIEKELRKAFTR